MGYRCIMIGDGIQALWNDCEVGHEDAYEAWYQGEHLANCLAVLGFRRGPRMESLTDGFYLPRNCRVRSLIFATLSTAVGQSKP